MTNQPLGCLHCHYLHRHRHRPLHASWAAQACDLLAVPLYPSAALCAPPRPVPWLSLDGLLACELLLSFRQTCEQTKGGKEGVKFSDLEIIK